MPPTQHLLLAGADACPPASLPALPALQRALQHWRALAPTVAQDDAPLTPAETLQAQLLQLPGAPGHQAFAALEAKLHDTPCAWITPCHVQLGMDRAQLHDPDGLQLTEADSRALMAALAPLLADLGVQLHWHSPLRWLAQGELLRDAYSISLARAAQGMLRHDQRTPDVSSQSNPTRLQLLRLHNEVEMQIYTHPVTDARAAQRLPAVNAIWLHGAGVLPAEQADAIAQRAAQLQLNTHLADAAAQGGEPAWQAAWQAIQGELAAQLNALRTHPQASISLCGEHATLTLTPEAGGLGTRVARWLKPVQLADLLAQLQAQAGAQHAL